MLIAEEFLLLVTSPEGKWLARSNAVPLALAGGALAELAVMSKVGVDDRDRIHVSDPAPIGDQVLDDALAIFVSSEGKRPKDVLAKVAKGLGERLYARLVDTRVVEVHEVWILPIRRFPLRDPAVRQRIWEQVAAVLRGSRDPDVRTGTLVGLALASGGLASIFEPQSFGMSRRDLQRRAPQIAEGEWVTDAVGKAVRDTQAAVVAAVTAAVAAATVGTSGSS